MHNHATVCRSFRPLRALWAATLLTLLFGAGNLLAQLNGTYTIGGTSPSYTDIPTAISALNTNGISGNVTFLIRGGTYNLTSAQTINAFTRTAAATYSTVTFKPDVGATVTIQSNTTSSHSGTGLFVLNNADYIIFDGSNTTNGTTRDMTLLNTATSASVIIMHSNADVNTVKNCKLMSNSSYYTTSPGSTGYSYSYGGIIHIYYGSVAAGNDSITIRNNQIGDPGATPTYRYAMGISAYGYSYNSASYMNQALKIVGNDIVNFGTGTVYNYGIHIGAYNQNTIVDSNEIRMTTAASYTSTHYLMGIARTDYYGMSPGFKARGNRIHDFRSTTTTTNYFYGIYDYNYYAGYYYYLGYGTHLQNDTSQINDNQIYDFHNTSSSNTGSILYYGVYSYPQYGYTSNWGVEIKRNRISDFSSTSGYYPTFYGVYCYAYNSNSTQSSNSYVDISGNDIYNFTVSSSQSIYYAYMYGIYYYGYYNRARLTVDSNNLHDMTQNGGQLSYGYSHNLYPTYLITDYANSYGVMNGDISVSRNRVYNVGRTASLGNYDYYYLYGVWLSSYFQTSYASPNVTMDRNRVSNFQVPTSGSYPYMYWYGVYGNIYYMSSGKRFSMCNNMVSLDAGSFTGLQQMYGQYYGGQYGSGWTGDHNYNSIYARATGTSSYVYPGYIYTYYSQATVNNKNNIYDIRTNYGYPLYWYTYQTTFNSNYNLVNVSTVSSGYPVIYYVSQAGSGYTYTSFSAFVSAQAKDQNSILGTAPFVDVNNGDLHISCSGYFPGQAAGTPVTGTVVDYDLESRSATAPDIGADETDKMLLTYPNGGEIKVTEDTANIRFTVSKSMLVNIFLSTNNGASWNPVATNYPAAPGANTFTIPAASFPSTPTDVARIRIQANAGSCVLNDTSNAVFRIVKPTIRIMTPNGGEQFVPTDTTQISWTSTFIPPYVNVQFEYSPNNGASWTPIGAAIPSPNNQPNSFNWIIPDNNSSTPLTTNLIRARLVSRTEADTTDRTFTILPTPFINLVTPVGGETFYVGRTTDITWTSRSLDYVAISYSVDNGTTWQPVVSRVPAYVGSYTWTIPNNLAMGTVQVRLNDVQRTRFTDYAVGMSIVKDTIAILSPNGGETYQLGQPITVNWFSQNVGTVSIQFSSNGGVTWTNIASGIDATNFTYAFTPAEVPTEEALVRIMSDQNAMVMDQSDMRFRIAPSANIFVYTPVAGDKLVRNSTTIITWQADGVSRVNVYYSSNGGSNWNTVANDVEASQGSYTWTVPNQTTQQGQIEIREVGGSLKARSGIFQIIDPTTSTLTVTAPNGGESYVQGDAINVTWTGTGVGPLTIQYSANGGQNWSTIATNEANDGSFNWTAPAPGTQYRVRVVSASPAAMDQSDANFTVTPRPQPALTVLYPNGGENLTIDSTVNIRWTSVDMTGPVTIKYSIDNGATWTDVTTTADVAAGQYSWTVPNAPSTMALVRIEQSAVADQSDAVFEISAKVVLPIGIIYPNGGETLTHNAMDSIVWNNPPDIAQVKLEYSTDGGTTWTTIQDNVNAVAGLNNFPWMTPNLPEHSDAMLVRVSMSGTPGRNDISDGVFKMSGISGVDYDFVTGGASLAASIVPNPNAGRAELRWNQRSTGDVTVTLLQSNGTEAGRFEIGRRDAGEQSFTIDGTDLPAGMYFYELRAGNLATRGMMVITR